METFGSYLLKSAVWLTGFAIIYLLFLRNERFFLLKRIYLISGILVSFIFPLITIHYKVEIPAAAPVPGTALPVFYESSSTVQPDAEIEKFKYNYMIAGLYLAGMIFLVFRMVLHFLQMFRTIKNSKINNRGPARIIRAYECSSSFSFFNYVFVSPSVSENEIEEIMNHEMVHVKQKHWFDLLLGEILRLIQWANPFAWIYTGFIRLNHEYLADEIALQQTSNPTVYKAALLNQMFRSPVISLSNSFNYSLNKKRFEMMKTIITSPYRKLKVLFVLPVFAIVFYAFSKPEYRYTEPAINTSIEEMTIYQAPAIQQKEVKGIVFDENGKPLRLVTIASTPAGIGTQTGSDGRFTLINISSDASLLVSCIGYKNQTLKPDFTSEMVIRMVKDPNYKGTVMTTDLTYYHEGENVRIRMTEDKNLESLIVIDDKISNYKGEVTLKRDDIESGWVLRGKDATDKYGERGKNGVIIIRTKNRASAGPPQAQLQMPPRIVTVDGVLIDKTAEEVRQDLGYDYGIMNIIRGKASADKPAVDTVKIITRKKALEMGLKPPFPRLTPDDYPTFEGQQVTGFNKWVAGQVKYPAEAKSRNIEGWVSVNLTVGLDGTMGNVVSTIPTDPLLSDEVIRVVKSSKWYPPKNPNVDEPYTTGVTLKFKLPDQIVAEAPFVVVEEMPKYPGGDVALLDFIKNNTKYPEQAKAEKIEGRVILRFVVSTEGKTEAISVLKGVHPLLDAEAVRVVSTMTGWQPGKHSGNPVNVWYMVPVNFSLATEQTK